jgi:hypothetical protein
MVGLSCLSDELGSYSFFESNGGRREIKRVFSETG